MDMLDRVVGGAVVGGVSGAVAVGLVLLVLAKLLKPLPCPECGRPTPMVRRPANLRQLLRGGLTCRGCGCELDARGQRVRAQTPNQALQQTGGA